MYDIDTGSTDATGALTWTWMDDVDEPPRLEYRQPTAPEYNDFDLARSKYRDRLQAHAEAREDDVDEKIEILEEALEDGETPAARVLEAIDDAREAIAGNDDPRQMRQALGDLQTRIDEEFPRETRVDDVDKALEAAIGATNALSEDVADTVLEHLDDLEALFEVDTDMIRDTLLYEGFRPNDRELREFTDFALACTTGLDNIGRDGEMLVWGEMTEDEQRTVLQSLGETPQARTNHLFDYATTIARGLATRKKKT